MSIRGTWRRLVAMIRRADIDAELRAEMEAHLGLAEDDLIARGLSPAKARERARREFGNPSLAREASREEWGWPSLESYAADLRFGWRMARRHWASTVVAVGALGVGVGATTGVVSTLDAAAHHRYGYSRPGELAILWAKSRRNPQYDEMQISLPELREWQRASRVRVGGFSWTESINVAAERSVERVRAVRVTSELLPLLGVRPAMGRWFTAEDDSPAAANTAVVSYSFWHDRLNARAAALGAPIIINRQPYAVIGVLPRGFEMPMLRDVPVLLSLHGASWASDPAARSLVAVGRFTTGATAAAVAAELNALSEHVERTPAETGQWTVNVDPLASSGQTYSRHTLAVMLGLSWLVLLVACANVGILILGRVPVRERELAIRLALGAARRRIVRQLLLESALVAFGAALLGLVLARPTNAMLVRLISDSLPFTLRPSLTRGAMAAAIAIAASTCAVFGMAPAITALRRASSVAAGRTSRQAGTRGQSWFRGVMLATEAAIAVMLMVCGWLMIESVRRMHATDLGFESRGLVTARLSLDAQRYPIAAAQQAFYGMLLDRLRARTDVRDATIATSLPLATEGQMASAVTRPLASGERADTLAAQSVAVMPGFFETLGTSLVEGTMFDPSTSDGVIVNEELARRMWPGKSAIGRTLTVGLPMFDDGMTAPQGDRRVIGVAPAIPFSLLRTASARRFPMFYVPAASVPARSMFVIVRAGSTEAGTRAMREEVSAIDPLLPLFSVRTSDDLFSYWSGPIRTDAVISGALAAVGLVLMMVGIYSVVAVFVSQRRREIGVRIAVGARTSNVVGLIVAKTLAPVGAGCLAGVAAALGTSRLAAKLFYDTSPLEARAFVGAVGLLAVVVILAAAVPARRAARVDPCLALRSD